MHSEQSHADAPRTLIVLPPKDRLDDVSAVRVWGLDAIQRIERSRPCQSAKPIETLAEDQVIPAAGSDHWIVLRADLFYDERLLAGLAETPDIFLEDVLPGGAAPEAMAAHVAGDDLEAAVEAIRARVAPQQQLPGAIRRVAKLDVVPAYNAALRNYHPPFVIRAESASVRKTENEIFAASYKGITDLMTKWVWPLPARELTRVLARRGVKPNSVTAVGYLLTILATWFFYEGWFAWGLACGWLMTFLDTVDGKLARCTLTSSRVGHVADHGLDLVHPPIWWAAWAYGLPEQGTLAGHEIATGIVLGGYLTGRLLEGVFLLSFDQELFTWRPFDAFFRTIIARRNPNLIILSVAVWQGRPDLGFLAVAGWTVVGNLVPAVRIGQAFAQRRRGVAIRPWHEEREAATEGRAATDSPIAG